MVSAGGDFLRLPALTVLTLLAGCGPGLFVSDAARGVYSSAAPAVVAVEAAGRAATAIGSGVVVARERVLTACHVLDSGSSIRVRHGSRAYPARVIRSEPGADLCELSVPALPAAPARMAASSSLHRGDAVYALAVPGGYRVELSEGRFAGAVRHQGYALLQTSARIDRGWSGGGLFARDGELVGILSFLLDSPGGDLNYAVAADSLSPGASGR